MAEIVLGIATSHGPMLSTPWENWGARVAFDEGANHDFRGVKYSFDELVALRRDEGFENQITRDLWQIRSKACGLALKKLAKAFSEAAPDVAVIVGNDQRELFSDQNTPAFSVFYGQTIENRP